jgi:ATP phosphoribosyltransferase regulatory subunit HisZ
VILIDQANGLKPESGIGAGSVEQLDSTWKALTQLAGERFALVVSPSQVTRAALDKKNVKQGDIAQWIGMLGHIDCGFALNQTPEEKREGVMRYSIMIHRHDDFNEEAVCIVLQNMKFGQIYLDAHITTSSDS